jgi:hypothetical protein
MKVIKLNKYTLISETNEYQIDVTFLIYYRGIR